MANNAFILDGGKSVTTARIKGVAGINESRWVGWGGGADQGTGVITQPSDTDLFSAHDEARVQGVSGQATLATANDTYEVVATLIASGPKVVNEVALFTDSVGGTCYAKGDHGEIELQADAGIQYTFQVQHRHEGQA